MPQLAIQGQKETGCPAQGVTAFGLVATALTPILKLLRVSEVHRALKLTRSQIPAFGDGPDHPGGITLTFPNSSSREWMLHPVPHLCKS